MSNHRMSEKEKQSLHKNARERADVSSTVMRVAGKNDHMRVTHWENKCLVSTDNAVFSIDFYRY